MKQLSFLLIIVIGLMTLSPAPVVSSLVGHTTVSIEAFDVCHGPATGINVNLPDFIDERPGGQRTLLTVAVRNIPEIHFTPLLTSYRDERPPRA